MIKNIFKNIKFILQNFDIQIIVKIHKIVCYIDFFLYIAFMKKHGKFCFYNLFFLFFFINQFSAQKLNYTEKNASYPELERRIGALENNYKEQWKYIDVFIKKAKNEKDYEQLSKAYLLASFSKRGTEQIVYADSTVIAALKTKNNDFIGDSYLSLGMSYANNENYPKALDNYLKGYHYIQKGEDLYLLNNAKYQIATVKNYLGLYKEADKLFESSVEFFRKNHHKIKDTDYRYYFIYALINYIDNNAHNQKLKDNVSLIKEGKDFIKENKDLKKYHPYFVSAEGIDYYFEGDYLASVNKLDEALKLYDDNWKHLTNKFYLGMSYWKMDKKDKALQYFFELDKDYSETGKLDPFFRPAFENLIVYYKETDDTKKQLEYVDKLIMLDKVFEKDFKYLSGTLKKEYDTKRLIEEKSNLENTIKVHHFIYLSLLGIGCLVIIILAFLIKKYYQRKKYFKKLYEEFLNQKEKSLDVDTTAETQNLDKEIFYNKLNINPLTVEKVLAALLMFEEEKQFLKKEITLSSLAKKCGTNTSYLSKIINHYKHANFAEYLNNLRLEYVVNQWKTKRKTRYVSIQDTAEKAGYSSTQAFAKNFQEKYQIPPSYFLNRLNKEENIDNLDEVKLTS